MTAKLRNLLVITSEGPQGTVNVKYICFKELYLENYPWEKKDNLLVFIEVAIIKWAIRPNVLAVAMEHVVHEISLLQGKKKYTNIRLKNKAIGGFILSTHKRRRIYNKKRWKENWNIPRTLPLRDWSVFLKSKKSKSMSTLLLITCRIESTTSTF